MFALDNLVRSAVHCAITVLSPEHEILLGSADGGAGVLVGAPGRARDAIEEGSTSGVSTINSTKSANALHDFHHSKHCHQLQEALQATRSENLRLLEELSLSEKRYGDLLKMYLAERRDQSQHLANRMGIELHNSFATGTDRDVEESNWAKSKRLCKSSSGESALTDNDNSDNSPVSTMGSRSSADTITAEKPLPCQSNPAEAASQLPNLSQEPPVIHVSSRNIDMELVIWLQSLSIDRDVIDKFLAQDYTKDDVLMWMTRDDLRRLRMRGGVELRLWRSMVQYRHSMGLPVNPEECLLPKQTVSNSGTQDSAAKSTKL
ncbi:Mitogen-activated protein kinase kinase kinase 5 [Halocaridina rubra]|uniref:Mitogen-activated protein kinase kinase kinase 5 n=1 Tax=Halocaridina rubra TaxID=373956 RepID=A0AAN8ZSZ9_HALRR